MATGATRLARLEERRRGREHARSRRQDRSRDAPLHHFAGSAGPPNRADDPRPLDDRKRPALGVGHGLPRRRNAVCGRTTPPPTWPPSSTWRTTSCEGPPPKTPCVLKPVAGADAEGRVRALAVDFCGRIDSKAL